MAGMDYAQFKGFVVNLPYVPVKRLHFLQPSCQAEHSSIMTSVLYGLTCHRRKPFQVVSKLGVRYTGIFDHISQEDQTICLSQGQCGFLIFRFCSTLSRWLSKTYGLSIVYNHGTEDRSTQRKIPGSTTTLGWVRFQYVATFPNKALMEREKGYDRVLSADVSQHRVH